MQYFRNLQYIDIAIYCNILQYQYIFPYLWPITHAIHNLARTLNVPSCQYYAANPRPAPAQEHARYTRVATLCTCPITTLLKPGTPRMCEYCDQLKYVPTQSPATACPVYAKPNSDTPSTCSDCVLYALIHQNTFVQRWNDVQTSLTTTRRQQIHPSLNYPQPVEHTTPPHDKGRPGVSVLATDTNTTQTWPNMFINLALTTHTLGGIRQVLMTTPASRLCTTTHISHPTLTLTMTHLHKLESLIQSIQDQILP